MNLGEFNGENNKSIMKKFSKDEQKEWMKTFTSTARTLYRGCWFFDFLREVFINCESQRDQKLSKVASAAYDKALGPHHPWLLRKVAGAAMIALNSRDTFLANYGNEQAEVQGVEYNEEKTYQDFVFLGQQAEQLAEKLWAFCKENGCDKLP